MWFSGTSLLVQWLRICAPNAEGPGLIPGQGTGSHMLKLRVCMPHLKRSHMLQLNIQHATTEIDAPMCHD